MQGRITNRWTGAESGCFPFARLECLIRCSPPGQLNRWAHFLDMQEAGTTTWKKRIDRPLGVYLITTYDFLVVGLIPLLTFFLFARNSDTEMSLPATMLSVGLYVVVMAFSVWACVGDNIGRWLLLSAVTL